MPLLHKHAELVLGDVHSVEVGEAVVALNCLNLELHFAPLVVVRLILQVSQRYLEHSSSQAVLAVF